MTRLLMTVDTEADDEWSYRSDPGHENGRRLARLQTLCDRYEVPVTWLVTWDMVTDPAVGSILRELVGTGRCEVGAHLHPWRTPPFDEHFDGSLAYPHELPDELVRQKLESLTTAIADLTGIAPRSYRAGRYGLKASHLPMLEALGYTVDSSVTPWSSWAPWPGLPGGPGGVDFRGAPERPYRPSTENMFLPGGDGLLEVPLSIRMRGPGSVAAKRWLAGRLQGDPLVRLARKSGWARREELRPALCTQRELEVTVGKQIEDREPVLNVLLHSSELYPGASPYATDETEVDRIFGRIEAILHTGRSKGAIGSTLADLSISEDFLALVDSES